MKNCIDKVLAFPSDEIDEGNKYREGRELNRQMNAAKELLAHIFDRNSALAAYPISMLRNEHAIYEVWCDCKTQIKKESATM